MSLAIAGSLVGGLFGSNSAKKAAEAQAAAAREQTALQREIYDDTTARFEPSYEAGMDYTNALRFEMLGGDRPVFGGDPLDVVEFTETTTSPNATFNSANPYWNSRDGNAVPQYLTTDRTRFRVGEEIFDDREAADAYAVANPTGGYEYQGFEETPYQKYILDQTRQSVDSSAASRGNLFSGATIKAQQDRASQLTGGFYNDYLNRLERGANAGQAAAGNMATVGANYASGSSNALANMGDAQAAGYIGSSNALMGGINNAVGIMNWGVTDDILVEGCSFINPDADGAVVNIANNGTSVTNVRVVNNLFLDDGSGDLDYGLRNGGDTTGGGTVEVFEIGTRVSGAAVADLNGAIESLAQTDGIDDNASATAITIASNGNVQIGGTTDNGKLAISGGIANLDNNQGIRWSASSGTSADGGIYQNTSDVLIIEAGASGTIRLVNNNAAAHLSTITSAIWRPGVDNTQSLGNGSFRFGQLLAANATISTSDERLKTDIREIDEAERVVARKLAKSFKAYRWRDAIEEKGEDARIHFGVIAQEVKQAFEENGLDAGRYSLFIDEPLVRVETDEDGKEIEVPDGYRLGVRYSELFAFIMAAMWGEVA